MKHSFYLSILFFLIYFFPASAQKTDGREYILNATEYMPPLLGKAYYASGRLPFKQIIVKDYRFDTSKIGYVYNRGGPSGYYKIKLAYDWSALLTNYFRSNLDPSSGSSLFVVIKSYWMQEGVIDEITTKKVIQKSAFGASDADGNCKAVLDVYIQTDDILQPFFKIEDTFLNFYKFKTAKLGEWFFLPFDSMARKITASDVAAVLAGRRKLRIAEADSFYLKRFDLPVLKTGLLPKGIYLSFEDFKNNKILSADFRLQQGKITDELYLVQNEKENLITEFWGFSDGKDLFIKSGFNVYASVRQHNSFEVFGGKHISNYHNNPSQGDLLRVNSMSVDRKILHLSMETGKFY